MDDTIEGRTRAPGEAFLNADMRFVEGDYFRAMRIPLVEGRLFVDGDRRPGPLVAVVDAHMAAQLWPGASPIGRRLQMGFGDDPDSPWITVVGVVGRVSSKSTLRRFADGAGTSRTRNSRCHMTSSSAAPQTGG